MKRTKAQRRWIRRGYLREMAPLRPLTNSGQRYTFVMGASEDWRFSRDMAKIMGMPIRPICKQFLHNGSKP